MKRASLSAIFGIVCVATVTGSSVPLGQDEDQRGGVTIVTRTLRQKPLAHPDLSIGLLRYANPAQRYALTGYYDARPWISPPPETNDLRNVFTLNAYSTPKRFLQPLRPKLGQKINDVCAPGLVLNDRFAAVVLRSPRDGLDSVVVDVAGDALRHPASLTKMMTLLLTFRAIEQGRARLTDTVNFSRHAREAFPVNLETEFALLGRHSLSLNETMQAAGAKSANDAAIALAEHIGGTESEFVTHMNEMAAEIGMTRTVFKNPSGLPDPGQVTTAYDLALLMRYISDNYPGYLKYLSLSQFDIQKSKRIVAAGLKAHRGKAKRNLSLFDRFVHIRGHLDILGTSVNGYTLSWGKTGYVLASGYNAVIGGMRPDGTQVMAVILGGKSAQNRNACMQNMVARL